MTERSATSDGTPDRRPIESDRERPIIIAIDGPAGSGKSSTAKAVAEVLGYRHLDSGAFYRTVTLAALESGIPESRWSDLTPEDLQAFQISAEPTRAGYRLKLQGEDVGDRIRSARVNAHVSRIAALPAVRHWLLDTLRQTGRAGGLVADGRDIGTVVFPDAELKVFLVCAPQERAARRLRERGVVTPSPTEVGEETVRLLDRDRQDSEREAAPLHQAADAVLLDTTHLTFPEQVEAIAAMARERSGG